jgi:hypothetical protein
MIAIKIYTREQIKEAIRVELTEADHMGKDNSRYYEVIGIVMAALDKLDKKNNNEQ